MTFQKDWQNIAERFAGISLRRGAWTGDVPKADRTKSAPREAALAEIQTLQRPTFGEDCFDSTS